MRSYIIYRALIVIGLWAMACIGLNGFISVVTAQEPTTDSAALPTPTSAPTWTPTPTTVGAPGPRVTATSPSGTPATPTGRSVDFRVDDTKISAGECVLFSWIVKGDIDKVEFDERGDDKSAVLVPEEQYDTEECPSSTTEYSLIVSWQDGAQTTRGLKVKIVSESNDGDNNESDPTATPDGTAASYMAVTPVPISGLPGVSSGSGQGATPQAVGATPQVVGVTPQAVAYQSVTTEGVIITPVGALGSVTLLPETGYGPPPPPSPAAGELAVRDRLSLAHLGDGFKICSVPVR